MSANIVLGTVQFGMNYGIANTLGQPSFESVCEILKAAADGGVKTIDTAAGYGESERVLGRALAELGLAKHFTLVSKVLFVKDKTPESAEKLIEESVVNSLKNLRLEQLPVCLFHMEPDLVYLPILEKLKAKGMIGNCGVSVDVAVPADINKVKFVQLASNLLDHRHDAFLESKPDDTTVWARSVYLQGLLLLPEEKITGGLKQVIPYRHKFEAIARESGITMNELCFRGLLSRKGISGIVTGVDSVEHLKENLAVAARGPLPADVAEEVRKAAYPLLPECIIRPHLWSGIM